MNQLATFYTISSICLLIGVLFLHLLPQLGQPGKNFSQWLCCAPGVDFVIAYFTLIAPLIGFYFYGVIGLLVAITAEYSVMIAWIFGHELAHRDKWQRPKIHRTLSSISGKLRNHLAVWITSLAVPGFWVVRFSELILYPPLTWLVHLPKYQTKDWVSLSRHKFSGLVGYDLIWCLYCDWMTGVWSLGTEMLRNVESFWCPIRFYDNKKCANCKQDFPDIDNGWISADRSIEQVTDLLESKHKNREEASWYGHPDRIASNDDHSR